MKWSKSQKLFFKINALIVLVLMAFAMNIQAQENLVLNGDFEDARKLNPKNANQEHFDKEEISKYIDGPYSKKAIAMHWNYIEYSKSSPNFQMFNAIYSENTELPHKGMIFSRLNVMELDYSDTDAAVTNIVGKLKSPLKAGVTYKVSLHLKPLNGNHFTKSICVSFPSKKIPYAIGIKKQSNEPLFRHGLKPAWCIPEILNDTSSYTKYEFTYTASGGEKYIYIGNILYEDKAYWSPETWEQYFEKTNFYGYRPKTNKFKCEYAIDDVSVVLLSDQ